MLHTPLCDMLAIDVPIIQAGMGPFANAELAAAVSNAGGLGSVGASALPSLDRLRFELDRIQQLTDRPFAINHNAVVAMVDPAAFELTLELRPAVIAFALSPPGDLVEAAHQAGSLVMAQVTSVAQAVQVADQGVDIVVAQGGEAGGFAGEISTLALVPQVVDAVRPLPVVAAGGIADGRGIAAALCLGAQAANIGTRFLTTAEAPVHESWQQAILAARSEDPRKVDVWTEIMPGSGGVFETTPRALSSPFIERWREHPDEARRQAEHLQAEVRQAVGAGRLAELIPFAGQSAGLVKDLVPAGQLVRRLAEEAAAALERAGTTLGPA
jgi:enoyl-[acyl-carrier protein] reductase II